MTYSVIYIIYMTLKTIFSVIKSQLKQDEALPLNEIINRWTNIIHLIPLSSKITAYESQNFRNEKHAYFKEINQDLRGNLTCPRSKSLGLKAASRVGIQDFWLLNLSFWVLGHLVLMNDIKINVNLSIS